jgi:hypothetical protein
MKRLLIGLALSVMATAASAEWVFVTHTGTGSSYYADPTTKRRTGKVVRIWEMADFTTPQVSNGVTYYSTRSYMHNDCAERSRQMLQLASFAGKMTTGGVVTSVTQPSSKHFVAPGTIAEALLNFACK